MNSTRSFFTLLFAILVIGTAQVNAQTGVQSDHEYHSAMQVSFFPPLSTNGSRAGLYTNDFSFNILAGVSKNEHAFALAGIANIIRNDATWFQFAGMVNYTGGEGRAFQWAGIANIVRGDHTGMQFGGLVNTAKELTGLQFGGLANKASEVEGFQFGGLANIAQDVDGFQFAGLGNIAREVDGFQFAGLANVANDVDGFQFGGLFNVARRVDGVQFAGLFNVAEESDYPIGLVNIIKEGEMGVAVGYNEIGTTSLTFRSGGRVLYGILGLGWNHNAPRKKSASVIGGYGAHINILPWLRLNNEITMESFGIFSKDSNTFKTGYALLPAFRPVRRVEIFGGPSINYMQSRDEDMFGLFPKNSFKKKLTSKRSSDRLQQGFIGWQAGVEFLF